MGGSSYAPLVREKAQGGFDLGWSHVLGWRISWNQMNRRTPVDVRVLGSHAVTGVSKAFAKSIRETNRLERWSIHD